MWHLMCLQPEIHPKCILYRQSGVCETDTRRSAFYNLDGDELRSRTTEIKWDAEAAEKAGFEHFMMKEIHEQPKAVRDTLNSVVKRRQDRF